VGGASRWWCGRPGCGERAAAAANSALVNTQSQWHIGEPTIQATRRVQNGLNNAHDALESLSDIGILGLDGLLLAQHELQVMVRLLALQLLNALVQAVNLRLGALANGALGLAVVCALPGELLGSEVCDATRSCARAAFLCIWLARVLAVIVFRDR
jgi:hypothetical protein